MCSIKFVVLPNHEVFVAGAVIVIMKCKFCPSILNPSNSGHIYSTLMHHLGGDKVSMLTHTYPHNPLKIEMTIYAITRLTAHFMCGLMSDLVICKFRKVWSYMTPNVLTETRCH